MVVSKIPKQTHVIMLGNEGLGKLMLIHNLKKAARHWKNEIREKEGISVSLDVLDEEADQCREEDEAIEAWKHIFAPISHHHVDAVSYTHLDVYKRQKEI